MSSTTTLLVTIEHPGLTEPLRLMCGCGFGILRTDNTGREIYGCLHEGREYLLAPFMFAVDGEKRLIMTMPPAYEEWFGGMHLDGARVGFVTPGGEPSFAFLPEEYRSASGVIHLDDQGALVITMDRVTKKMGSAFRLP